MDNNVIDFLSKVIDEIIPEFASEQSPTRLICLILGAIYLAYNTGYNDGLDHSTVSKHIPGLWG